MNLLRLFWLPQREVYSPSPRGARCPWSRVIQGELWRSCDALPYQETIELDKSRSYEYSVKSSARE